MEGSTELVLLFHLAQIPALSVARGQLEFFSWTVSLQNRLSRSQLHKSDPLAQRGCTACDAFLLPVSSACPQRLSPPLPHLWEGGRKAPASQERTRAAKSQGGPPMHGESGTDQRDQKGEEKGTKGVDFPAVLMGRGLRRFGTPLLLVSSCVHHMLSLFLLRSQSCLRHALSEQMAKHDGCRVKILLPNQPPAVFKNKDCCSLYQCRNSCPSNSLLPTIILCTTGTHIWRDNKINITQFLTKYLQQRSAFMGGGVGHFGVFLRLLEKSEFPARNSHCSEQSLHH